MIFPLFTLFFVPGIWAFWKVPADYPCAGRQASHGLVCVCNSTYCDKIERVGRRIPSGQVLIYRSDLAGDRMTKYVTTFIGDDDDEEEYDTVIHVDPSETYQKIIGYGGSFSDSTGANLLFVKERLQRKVLEAYFGPDGLEYSVGRVPIGSTDFSTHLYSYDDQEGDYDLEHFELAPEDVEYKIRFIKRALKLQPSLKLFGSAWSPPAWMKTNGKMYHGGSLIDSPLVHQTYADYLAKFFEEYARFGVHFWGITVQNEPRTSGADTWKWQGLRMTPEMERDFLRDYLGPTLRQKRVTRKLKVMVLDDVRTDLEKTVDTIFNDPDASEFADGVAVHWYDDIETPIKVFDTTHQNHPDKFLLATEACLGFENSTGPELGNWARAEVLALSNIEYLNHWVGGWVDWNMVLDEEGGPNWVNNWVDAGIIMNRNGDEFYKQPIFYSMGHFSKFIPADSHVIHHSYQGTNGESIACVKTPKQRRVCVILNQKDIEIITKIVDKETGKNFVVPIAPRSLQTILWEKK